MNTFIQTIIKFFLRLIQPKTQNKPAPTTNTPAPKPAPKPPAPTDAADPVLPQPTEEPAEPTPPPAPAGELQFSEAFEEKVGTDGQKIRQLQSVTVTDGQKEGVFRMYYSKNGSWEGLYTRGQRPMKDFIEAEPALLQELEMSKSSQKVLQAVSDNEGMLEAINAYDGAFLSFGIFQWTLGTRDNAGELAALMKKLKDAYPDTFEQHFGKHGLDIDAQTNSSYGYLTLDGEIVKSREIKDQFRGREWVYRFWRAGSDTKVQAIEVAHALSRLKSFYWTYKVHGFPLNEIITSEYGVGLILDNHVNLPGLVKRALEAAMNETGLTDPSTWGTEEESRVLEAYIRQRATKINGIGPMYDAKGRAAKTHRYVEQGVISAERGSFSYTGVRSRGGSLVPQPRGFNPADYPDLEVNTDERDMGFLGGKADQ